jgi:hypothetical protein
VARGPLILIFPMPPKLDDIFRDDSEIAQELRHTSEEEALFARLRELKRQGISVKDAESLEEAMKGLSGWELLWHDPHERSRVEFEHLHVGSKKGWVDHIPVKR